MINTLSWVVGAVFALVGILGFVPGVTPDSMLLGIFHIDPLHNAIHIVSGLIFLYAAWSGAYQSLAFKVIGAVYAIVTIVGFVQGDTVLGLIMVNPADNILHLALAVVLLGIGFGLKDAEAASGPISTTYTSTPVS